MYKMLLCTFFVLSLFFEALTYPIEGDLYNYFIKCENSNDWSLVDLESIGLLPHNGNTEAMRSSAFSCLSSLPIHFKSGSTLELSVYVNTTSGQSGITILIFEDSENDVPILNDVYDRSKKDFVAGWSTIFLPIEREITGYITVLGVSQDQDVVLLDDVQYKFNEAFKQHSMKNEEKLSSQKLKVSSLLNFETYISNELEIVTEIRPDVIDPYEPDVRDPDISDRDESEHDQSESDVDNNNVSDPEPDEGDPNVSDDVSEPGVFDSDVSEPDMSVIDVSDPDVDEPDESEPDSSELNVSEPDMSEPDVGELDISESDSSEPDVSEPDVSKPDVSEPDVGEPDVNQPKSGLSAWAIVIISVSCVSVTALAGFGAYRFGKLSGKKQLPPMASFPPSTASVAPSRHIYNSGPHMSSFSPPSATVAHSTTYTDDPRMISRVRPDVFDRIQNDFYDYRRYE